MLRTFIIGDIHGCCNTFQRLVLDEICIRKSDKIYCLGDYIDRGPYSKGVIDFILSLRKSGYHIHTLRGNHEQMLLNSTKMKKLMRIGLEMGAIKHWNHIALILSRKWMLRT
ncbi:MAG: serine/threonine protein phosphatase [Bacteroidetes bacterium]|nr:serine/threonine protein phosphatase [Bacteroidota bacterium]